MQILGWYEDEPERVSTTPEKKALLVLIENGGMRLDYVSEFTNIPLPPIEVKVPAVSCGNLSIQLPEGESLESYWSSILTKVGDNLTCLNPSNWTVGTKSVFSIQEFDDWWEVKSDYIVEEVAKALILAQEGNSSHKYDRVVIMDDDFKKPRVFEKLDELAQEYTIDLHLLCHGGTHRFDGVGQEQFNRENFFIELKKALIRGEKTLPLRAVYQMNCSSGSLTEFWLGLGAKVVCGDGI